MTYYLKSGLGQNQPTTSIDLIYDQNGDWAALYVNGECRFQGHSITDDNWKALLTELGAVVNDYQESDFTETGQAPLRLSEVEITYG